ncbi:MAG: histidine phosphatase family protein [Ferruginibacter sp.]
MLVFKRFFIALTLVFTTFVSYSQKCKQTFYIVRHAEKDTGSDPSLSAPGKIRAGDLYRTLKNKNIDIIYATKYKRTQMTGDSLKIYQQVKMLIYPADTTGEGLVQKIENENETGKNILIIGHSNTILPTIKRLGVKNISVNDIQDDEYDYLFIIRYKKNKAILKVEKYGAKQVNMTQQNKMNPLQ